MATIEPFEIHVPDDVLTDLRNRVRRARLPNAVTTGWEMGVPPSYLQEMLTYWADEYDWREQEARLNAREQFVTVIDGQRIHFIRVRSPATGALPLLLLHGWPGSIVEFLDVMDPLSDPTGHDGSAAEAFELIIPSHPGYGFSGPTTSPGWHTRRIAQAYARLMADLGFDRYGVQGGDAGAFVAQNLADLDRTHVCGLHLNTVPISRPKGDDAPLLTAAEEDALRDVRRWRTTGTGYSAIQSTKPQTLGCALEDSPAGLCAWIVEKFHEWTAFDGDLEEVFSRDQLLTNVMVYWVTRTATSSIRLYYEGRVAGRAGVPHQYVSVPTGVAQFPGDLSGIPRAWVERRYNVTRWTQMRKGSHFAAMEVPELFVEEVRAFFGAMR